MTIARDPLSPRSTYRVWNLSASNANPDLDYDMINEELVKFNYTFVQK